MQKGIDYVGIAIVFFCHDGKGDYVFSKRGKNCRDEHGTWDVGAGGLEVIDSIDETLRKEIKEEYCTDVLEYEFLGYRDVFREYNGIKNHWIGLDFRVKVDPSKVQNGEPHKFDEVEWFRLDNPPTPLHSQIAYELSIYKLKLL